MDAATTIATTYTMSFAITPSTTFRQYTLPTMGRPQIALPDSIPVLSLGYSRYVPPSPTPSDEGEMEEFGPIQVIAPPRVQLSLVRK
jgi:hypothetical protein